MRLIDASRLLIHLTGLLEELVWSTWAAPALKYQLSCHESTLIDHHDKPSTARLPPPCAGARDLIQHHGQQHSTFILSPWKRTTRIGSFATCMLDALSCPVAEKCIRAHETRWMHFSRHFFSTRPVRWMLVSIKSLQQLRIVAAHCTKQKHCTGKQLEVSPLQTPRKLPRPSALPRSTFKAAYLLDLYRSWCYAEPRVAEFGTILEPDVLLVRRKRGTV